MKPDRPLPTFAFEDGRTLVATDRIPGDSVSPFDTMNAQELRDYVLDLWRDAFDAKRAEMERLKMNSLYYDGFHYTNAWQNRVNPVANYTFSVTETVVAALTEMRPRPEIVPRRAGMTNDFIDKLSEAANWLMDVGKWDVAVGLGARDKCIYGWNCWIVSIDYKSGMPFVKNCSVFDVYPDPNGRNEDECEYFFLASAVSTMKLKATYPKMAAHIRSDGVASPSYDVIVRPWQQYLEDSHRYESPAALTGGLLFKKEGESSPEGHASLVHTGETNPGARTTMLIQLIHKDDFLHKVMYVGEERSADGQTVTPGMHHEEIEPVENSGWRLVTMTAEGAILDNREIDDCFDGHPLVFDFDYRRTDRFYSVGEQDNVIPLQRRDNRRSALISRAIELAMNPPVVTNRDSGLPADKGTVAGGELLRISRGSELKYLEFKAPIDMIQNIQAMDARVMDTISGVQDVSQGQRPAGIEAASAIRRLQEAAQTRVRAKEPQAHDARARLLRKLMVCAGKKLQANIGFKGSSGAFINLNPPDLIDQYDIRFVPGTGTANGRAAQEEKAFALHAAGAIDEQELLTAVDWKNRQAVMERMAVRHAQELQIAMEQAKSGGGPSGQKNGGRAAQAVAA